MISPSVCVCFFECTDLECIDFGLLLSLAALGRLSSPSYCLQISLPPQSMVRGTAKRIAKRRKQTKIAIHGICKLKKHRSNSQEKRNRLTSADIASANNCSSSTSQRDLKSMDINLRDVRRALKRRNLSMKLRRNRFTYCDSLAM